MTDSAEQIISRRSYQRTIPVFIVSILVGIFLVEYFIAYEPLTALTDELSLWGVIITAGTALFGNVAVIIVKAQLLRQKQTRRELFDIATFLGVAALFVILGLADPEGISGQTLFLALYTPTMSMVSRTLWTNAHLYFTWAVIQRLVRVRTLEVAVLAIACMFLIFYNTPVTIVAVPAFHPIGEWIVTVLNKAVQRATAACLAVGGIVIMVRALTGKEPGLIEMEMA
jgi:hypothetical protein